MTMVMARFNLLLTWALLFLLYVVTLIFLPKFRSEIDPHEAREAVWKTTYLLIPVLAAFASFLFGPQLAGEPKEAKKLDWQVFAGIVIFTLIAHIPAVCYFFAYVVFAEYSFSNNVNDSFAGCVTERHKFLALASTVAVLPVGYVLKRADLKSLTDLGGESALNPDAVTPRARKRKAK